jgi:hypothetical protein
MVGNEGYIGKSAKDKAMLEAQSLVEQGARIR